MGAGWMGPGLWDEFLFFPKQQQLLYTLGLGGSGEAYAPFLFFLRVGFGRLADIHWRIAEGDAHFWLLPGLFSPAPCGRAEDSAWLWPQSLTYDSKKAQNPQRSQGAPSTASAA